MTIEAKSLENYQNMAWITINKDLSLEEVQVNTALGLLDEVIETLEVLDKAHESPESFQELVLELGDAWWYASCATFSQTLSLPKIACLGIMTPKEIAEKMVWTWSIAQYEKAYGDYLIRKTNYRPLQKIHMLHFQGLLSAAKDYGEIIKKKFFHGRKYEESQIASALGEVLAQLTLVTIMVGGMGRTLKLIPNDKVSFLYKVLNDNIQKLSSRWPEGFKVS